ncbi:hypothetical protein [Aquimarina megaterium]|uniref:hypothetical protein n=1 Tax=Aquimarina megaterium TaxID=1443666 RepID=UPI0019D3EECF|nr:hypothetical protein [Aquimarina megaterium]
MRKSYQLAVSVLMLLLLSIALVSCNDKKKEVDKPISQETVQASNSKNIDSTENYEIVPNEKVCMVNDRFMGVSQIAIDVKGITYYGCCENCVEKLQKNIDNVRFGTNPINDTKVDKASAIIVQDKSNGSVFYFASQQDAQTFINNNKA